MCERCWLDLMMYGEPAEHEAPVWEKGRFQAKPVEEESPEPETKAAASAQKERKPGREQES